ncbi:MAG: hypothetical protein ACE5OY_04325 [Candidatus Bathyarchaeia archaeon]
MSPKLSIYGPLQARAVETYLKLELDAVFTEIERVDDDTRRGIADARDGGIGVYACTWAFKAPHGASGCGIVNAEGEREIWARAGCPNNPTIREASLAWAHHVLVDLEIDGLVLDGVRFPSPGSGLRAFLSCFCSHCFRKAQEWGVDLERVRKCLSDRDRFGDQTIGLMASRGTFPDRVEDEDFRNWVSFRCNSILEHVEAFVETAKEADPSTRTGAALFAPSLSLIVGQDYRRLCQVLDFLQPMVYERGTGIACINFELAQLFGEAFSGVRGKSLKVLYEALGYSDRNPLNPTDLKNLGLDSEVVEKEIRRAKVLTRQGRARLTPILFALHKKGDEVNRLVETALSCGVGEIVLFAYEEGINDHWINRR